MAVQILWLDATKNYNVFSIFFGYNIDVSIDKTEYHSYFPLKRKDITSPEASHNRFLEIPLMLTKILNLILRSRKE